MGTLEDVLSGGDRIKLIIDNIHIGDVFRMKLTEEEGVIPKNKGDIDRNKYFIVIGKNEDQTLIGFVLINTNINNHLPPHIQALTYLLLHRKYPFLKKDRYVCCSELKEITYANFTERYMISNNYQSIDNEDLEHIFDILKTSPLIMPKELKRYNIK